ncbi:polysaccharide biosynthesis tyrosine autokinase [Collimonas sp.]|jgi:tyrosine-protein kinase Etk/Wzc|uniref:polysaccharide biosynthesis tyrosine autokinase n=1 Tax=Collimonas sp. TaxID=1963772 RepID=UPI002C5C6E74|nr:polysaccharide biosynthesis tyrosine autokinase [Collimonas sp.]HWX00976.1 polysaccharide biosynthesis tyrosine autokinase [Collimonas sp.]
MTKLTQPLHLSAGKDDELNLAALLDVLVDNRKMIGIVTIVFFLLGTLYAFLGTPVYQADILVQVEDNSASAAASNMLADMSSMFDVKSTAAAEIEILGSRLVVSRSVDALHLYIDQDPRHFPLIGGWIARHNKKLSAPGLLGYGGYAWGNESMDADVFNVPQALEEKKFKLQVLEHGRYRLSSSEFDEVFEGSVGKLEKFAVEGGNLELRVASFNARPGIVFALVRNARLKTILDLQDQLVIVEKGKQSGVIGATWQGTDARIVSETLNQIGQQYVRQNIERKSAEAAKSLDFLNEQVPLLKSELEQAENLYNALRNKLGSISMSDEGAMVLQKAVDTQTQLLELKQKRKDLAMRFSDSHPSLKAVDEQIRALYGEQGKVNGLIKRFPNNEQDLLRLTRDVTVNTTLYTGLLGNIEQLKLVKAGKIGNVRLVDVAALPEIPVKPKKLIVLPVSLLLGLFLSVTAAFIRNMLFSGVTDANEIEQHTGLSVYSTIPRSDAQLLLSRQARAKPHEVSLLAVAQAGDLAIESLRSLRTALQFAMLEAKNNIVLLTGPSPGVGKSFIAANLAAVVASSGKRVLLIDADLRKGHLNEYFGFGRDGGFSELVSGSLPVAAAIHREVVAGLDFIATGKLPPNPAELLTARSVGELLKAVAEQYDIVIVDSPPVLAVADPAILAEFSGTTFLVARSGITKIGEILESARRLVHNGSHPKGVLFNGLDPNVGRYGYGSKYGSYRYTAYSYEKTKRLTT